jgi:hypothetical protein
LKFPAGHKIFDFPDSSYGVLMGQSQAVTSRAIS